MKSPSQRGPGLSQKCLMRRCAPIQSECSTGVNRRYGDKSSRNGKRRQTPCTSLCEATSENDAAWEDDARVLPSGTVLSGSGSGFACFQLAVTQLLRFKPEDDGIFWGYSRIPRLAGGYGASIDISAF